ncbi:MAG: condensin subunit MukF [Myxococcales bacterium]|nr:condensin subunit MukF [Myxococcales bacterium]
MALPARSNEQILRLIAQQQVSLQLSTLELGFLVALHLQTQGRGLTSFNEAQLEDTFIEASLLLMPEADQRKRRATHAIKRLREQRLLARVDGQGVTRAGEFTLSRLALGIVEFYLEDGVLTRESLLLLTSSLRGALEQVRDAARDSPDAERWQTAVVGPLRVTIAELVDGIERRQRGLDLQQEDFRSEIRRLLEEDWFAALTRCQALLDATSATLQELNHVLLRDSTHLLALLQDIEEHAIAAGQPEAEAAARRLMDQVDRIAAWGAARQRAFSDYFQYVHRYLRDVVRLDPSRALTQRLRDQLAGRGARFALTHSAAGPLQMLRTVVSVPDKPKVVRPRAPREKPLAPDEGEDREAILTERVQGALEQGARALSSVTALVTEALPAPERFVEAGRVAHKAAQLARAQSEIDRAWVAAGDGLVIEEWSLDPGDSSE